MNLIAPAQPTSTKARGQRRSATATKAQATQAATITSLCPFPGPSIRKKGFKGSAAKAGDPCPADRRAATQAARGDGGRETVRHRAPSTRNTAAATRFIATTWHQGGARPNGAVVAIEMRV